MRGFKPKYLKIIIPILLALGFIAWAVAWGGSTNEGTISPPSATKGPSTYTDKQLNGTYISFQYGGKYTNRDEAAKDNDIERHTLTADTRYDKRILASVSNLPDGQLTSNGGYLYRQKTPSLYTSRTVKLGGSAATVWAKNDGTEQTVIMARGTRAATISFVTANTKEDLTAEINALLKTFDWKK
jgi:hypothetical protein